MQKINKCVCNEGGVCELCCVGCGNYLQSCECSNNKSIEELFEEYADTRQIVFSSDVVENPAEKKRKEIIQEVTKQIQSDLLKEVLEFAEEEYNFGSRKYKIIFAEDIKKLAEEKNLTLN